MITVLAAALKPSPARYAHHMRMASPPTDEGNAWLKKWPIKTTCNAVLKPSRLPFALTTASQRSVCNSAIDSAITITSSSVTASTLAKCAMTPVTSNARKTIAMSASEIAILSRGFKTLMAKSCPGKSV